MALTLVASGPLSSPWERMTCPRTDSVLTQRWRTRGEGSAPARRSPDTPAPVGRAMAMADGGTPPAGPVLPTTTAGPAAQRLARSRKFRARRTLLRALGSAPVRGRGDGSMRAAAYRAAQERSAHGFDWPGTRPPARRGAGAARLAAALRGAPCRAPTREHRTGGRALHRDPGPGDRTPVRRARAVRVGHRQQRALLHRPRRQRARIRAP